MGWPGAENSTDSVQEEYNRYFPAALLETGYDILFFWVARMAMMSLELTGKSPFETVLEVCCCSLWFSYFWV